MQTLFSSIYTEDRENTKRNHNMLTLQKKSEGGYVHIVDQYYLYAFSVSALGFAGVLEGKFRKDVVCLLKTHGPSE